MSLGYSQFRIVRTSNCSIMYFRIIRVRIWIPRTVYHCMQETPTKVSRIEGKARIVAQSLHAIGGQVAQRDQDILAQLEGRRF